MEGFTVSSYMVGQAGSFPSLPIQQFVGQARSNDAAGRARRRRACCWRQAGEPNAEPVERKRSLENWWRKTCSFSKQFAKEFLGDVMSGCKDCNFGLLFFSWRGWPGLAVIDLKLAIHWRIHGQQNVARLHMGVWTLLQNEWTYDPYPLILVFWFGWWTSRIVSYSFQC